MTSKPERFFFEEHFQSKSTAEEYDQTTGGVTLAVAQRILRRYLSQGRAKSSFNGKVVFDNACGTGVVTKEILRLEQQDGEGFTEGFVKDNVVREEGVRIEAADVSEAMVDYLRSSLEQIGVGEGKVKCSVMDAQELTYPDNTFDLTITLMGIMFFPSQTQALQQLHRVTRPNGLTYITTWSRLGHKDLCNGVLRKYRPSNPTLDTPMPFWNPDIEKPEYLVKLLEEAGFRDCAVETKKEEIFYPGEEGIKWGMEILPRMYAKMMKFEGQDEERRWKALWGEELRGCCDETGMKVPMWANIAWGTK